MMDRETMMQIFSRLNEQLRERGESLELIVIGYSAIVLHGGSARGTEDIDDVVANRFTRLLQSPYIQLLEQHYFHFHPEFRTRLHECGVSFTHLNLYHADPYDIFLLKLDAYREKDVKDLRHMLSAKIVEEPLLNELFEEWLAHWYPNNEEIRRNYQQVMRGSGHG